MMFAHWTRDKGKPPGVWAIHNVLNAAEAAEAVKASIPKAKGYIDGIASSLFWGTSWQRPYDSNEAAQLFDHTL